MSSRGPGDNIYSSGISSNDHQIWIYVNIQIYSTSPHHHQFDFPASEPNLVLSDKALDTHMTTVWVCAVFV